MEKKPDNNLNKLYVPWDELKSPDKFDEWAKKQIESGRASSSFVLYMSVIDAYQRTKPQDVERVFGNQKKMIEGNSELSQDEKETLLARLEEVLGQK